MRKGQLRNQTLDKQKFIAEIFVVFIHIKFPGMLGLYVRALARYAVPLFFLIAGYFAYSENTGNIQKKLKKRIAWLAEVIVVSSLLFVGWRMCRLRFQPEAILEWLKSFSIKEAVLFVCFNSVSFIRGHLWYLFALLYLYIIMLLVNHYQKYQIAYRWMGVLFGVQILLNEVAAAAGYVVPLALVQNFLVMAFPYFFLGHYVRAHEEKIMEKLPAKKNVVVAGILGVLLTTVSWAVLGKRINYYSIITYIGSNITAIALFLYAVRWGKDAKPSKLARWGEKYLLFIYIVHPIIGETLEGIAMACYGKRLTIWNYIIPIAACVLTLGVGVIFYGILEWVKRVGKEERT